MNLFSLSATIGLDTSTFESGVESAEKSATSLAKAIDSMATSANADAESLAAKIKTSASSIDGSNESTEASIAALAAKYVTEGDNIEDAIEKASKTVEQELADMKSAEDKQKSNAQQFADDYVSAYEGMASKVGSTVTSIVTTVAKIGAAVATATVALAAVGVSYNTQIESYEASMGVLLGSTQAGIDKVAELADFAASTPFELTTLADATTSLLAYGVAAEDSTEIMSQLGDIALGDADKFDTLINAYGKMASSEKVSLEYINMMIESGFNPLNVIAEETGESMEELYDRISAGTLAYDEVVEAIEIATSEGGQFYDGMAVGASTTEGLMSTLKDSINSQLGSAFSSVSEKIKDLLPVAIEFVNSLDTEAIGEQVSAVIEKVVELTEEAIAFVQDVDFEAVVEKAQAIYDTFVTWSPVIAGIITTMTALYAIFKAMTIINTVRNAILLLNAAMLANPAVFVVALIVGLIAALVVLWNTNEEFRTAVTTIWNTIVEVFTTAIETIVAFFTETLPETFWAFVETVQEIIETVITFVTENWAALLLLLVNPISGALLLLYNLNPQFQAWVNALYTTMLNLAAKFVDIGTAIVDGIWQGISNGWSWLTSQVAALATSLFTAAKNALDIASPSKAFAWLGEMSADGFGVGFEDEMGTVKNDVENAMNFSVTPSTSTSSSGVSIVQNIYSTAQSAASLMQEALYNQKKAVITGV